MKPKHERVTRHNSEPGPREPSSKTDLIFLQEETEQELKKKKKKKVVLFLILDNGAHPSKGLR